MSSSLSQRLKAVQEEIVVEHKAPQEFSLDELKQMTVTWGQKGKGSTFIHMCDTDQKWVSWQVSHYETSPKKDHVLFIHFVSIMIERLELTGGKVKVPVAAPITTTEPTEENLIEERLSRIEKFLGISPKAVGEEEQ